MMNESMMEIGDLVQLKSGGPTMTIVSQQDQRWGDSEQNMPCVQCAWFDEGRTRNVWFPIVCVKAVTSNE